MSGAFTRETLDRSSLLKMRAKIKLGRGKGTKKRRVAKAPPLPHPPGGAEQASPDLQSENQRQ
jgi:hypothetical protein